MEKTEGGDERGMREIEAEGQTGREDRELERKRLV